MPKYKLIQKLTLNPFRVNLVQRYAGLKL